MSNLFFQVFIVHCQIHEIARWRDNIALSIIESKHDVSEWSLDISTLGFLDPAIPLAITFITLDFTLSGTRLFIELILHNGCKFWEHIFGNLNSTEECVDSGISKVKAISVDIWECPLIFSVTDKSVTNSQLPSCLAGWLVPINWQSSIHFVHHHVCFASKSNIRT
jgi:hypothetical protein